MEFKLNETLRASEMRQYKTLCFRLSELKRGKFNGRNSTSSLASKLETVLFFLECIENVEL